MEKITETDLKLLISNGYNNIQLAEIYNCSIKTITTYKNKFGLTRKKISINKEDLQNFFSLGLSAKKISEIYGCSETTIFRYRNKYNIDSRRAVRWTEQLYDKFLEINTSLTRVDPFITTVDKIMHVCNKCKNSLSRAPGHIMEGRVCSCGTGYKYLYIIEFENGLKKVGVTNNPKGRQALGAPYRVLSWLESEDNTAQLYEKELLNFIKPYLVNEGFLHTGNTETYRV